MHGFPWSAVKHRESRGCRASSPRITYCHFVVDSDLLAEAFLDAKQVGVHAGKQASEMKTVFLDLPFVPSLIYS